MSRPSPASWRTISRLRGRVTIIFIAHHLPDSLEVDVTARLERGRAGLGRAAGVFRRREIAEAQPGIIVAWADQSVEIDFGDAHLTTARHA